MLGANQKRFEYRGRLRSEYIQIHRIEITLLFVKSLVYGLDGAVIGIH